MVIEPEKRRVDATGQDDYSSLAYFVLFNIKQHGSVYYVGLFEGSAIRQVMTAVSTA
jgi:hypothetical protein